MSNAIDLQILDQEQEIAHLLALQQELVMSEQPKLLSRVPQAICFKVNIRSYLSSNSQKLVYGCIFPTKWHFSFFAVMNTKRFKDDLSHELLHLLAA